MQQIEQMSDKYEDQYERLNNAMVALFKYDNLLRNEYLIRKFQPDPFSPNSFLLQYESVQRENSIKSQYVQNEQNTRKQYHLILTDILKKNHRILWEYDDHNLVIRPYFPTERKRVQIKLLSNESKSLQEIMSQQTHLTFEEQPNQANTSQVKLFATAENEEQAQKLFTFLREKKDELHLDTVMMMNIDYLEEFHKQLNQKKLDMYYQREQPSGQYQRKQYDHEEENQQQNPRYAQHDLRGHGGQRNERGKVRGGYKQNYYNNQANESDEPRQDREKETTGRGRGRGEYRGARDAPRPMYVQKQEPQPVPQEKYQLVPKSVLQKTPKQGAQKVFNNHDFPPLEAVEHK